jgi:hypothetical protein
VWLEVVLDRVRSYCFGRFDTSVDQTDAHRSEPRNWFYLIFPHIRDKFGELLARARCRSGREGCFCGQAPHWHYSHYGDRTTPYGAIRWGSEKPIEFYEDGRLEVFDLQQDTGQRPGDVPGCLHGHA